MTYLSLKNGSAVPSLAREFGFPSLLSDTLDRFWNDDDVKWMPSVNISERDEDFKIDLAVPGMDKKDFNVEVDNGVLTITGERKEESESKEGRVTRREFHYGAFRRTFNLPEIADENAVKASYRDGILTLVIGKREEAKRQPRKQISIE